MPTSLDNFARAFQAAYDSQLRAAAQAAELRLRDLALAQEAAKAQELMKLKKEELDLDGRKVKLLEEEGRRKQESFDALQPVQQMLLKRMTESIKIKEAMDLVKQRKSPEEIKAITGVDVNAIRENTVDYVTRLAQRGDVEAANTIAVTYGLPFLFGFDQNGIVATFGDGKKLRIAMAKPFDLVENIMRLINQTSGKENKDSSVDLPKPSESKAAGGPSVAEPSLWGWERGVQQQNTSRPSTEKPQTQSILDDLINSGVGS
jgi:hypothetical protein